MDGSGHNENDGAIQMAGAGEQPHPDYPVPPAADYSPAITFHQLQFLRGFALITGSAPSEIIIDIDDDVEYAPGPDDVDDDGVLYVPGPYDVDDDGVLYVPGPYDVDDDGDMVIPEYAVDDAYRDGGFGAVPASGEAIAELAEAAVGETRESECAVCMESFVEGDKLRKMPCSHGFHESCISEWLRVSRLCPHCRFALPAATDDDDEKEGAEDMETEMEVAAAGESEYEDSESEYQEDEDVDDTEEFYAGIAYSIVNYSVV